MAAGPVELTRRLQDDAQYRIRQPGSDNNVAVLAHVDKVEAAIAFGGGIQDQRVVVDHAGVIGYLSDIYIDVLVPSSILLWGARGKKNSGAKENEQHSSFHLILQIGMCKPRLNSNTSESKNQTMGQAAPPGRVFQML